MEQSDGPGAHFRRAGQRLQTLIRSLSRGQWDRLAANEPLAPQHLTRGQWTDYRGALVELMAEGRGPHLYTPRAEALEGKALIRLKRTENPGKAWLEFSWATLYPYNDGEATAMVELRRDTDGDWRLVPAINPKVPIELSPPSSDAPPPMYREDPHLGGKVEIPGDEATWEDVLKGLAVAAKSSFLVSGQWLSKPVPFRANGRSVVEVMDAMAAAAKGRWERVGSVWVMTAALPMPRW